MVIVCNVNCCVCNFVCVTRMVKDKPAASPVLQVPSTSAAVVDVSVSNMGDGKREKVCIFYYVLNTIACNFSP